MPEGNEAAAESGGSRAPWWLVHARLLRWMLVPAFVIAFGGFYGERASRSDYLPVTTVKSAVGILQEMPPGGRRRRSASIAIAVGDGRLLRLMCEPNARWRTCVSTKALRAASGKPVRAEYFTYERAKYGEDVILSLTVVRGPILIDRNDQLSRLEECQKFDKTQDFWSSLPLSLTLSIIIVLCLEYWDRVKKSWAAKK